MIFFSGVPWDMPFELADGDDGLELGCLSRTLEFFDIFLVWLHSIFV
jgi:hypothetical protein